MRKVCGECGLEGYILSFQTMCYKCQRKKHLEEIKENIIAGETEVVDCDDDIICPWCGEVYESCDRYDLNEEGEHEIECECCERKFTVNTQVTFSFETYRGWSE